MKTCARFGTGVAVMLSIEACVMREVGPGAEAQKSGSVVTGEAPAASLCADGSLFEIATVRAENGLTTNVLLTRAEIASAFPLGFLITNDFKNVEIERTRLVDALLGGQPTAPYRAAVESTIRNRTVYKTYSLEELGVRDSTELLHRFFKKTDPASKWWVLKGSSQFDVPREPDLVATLKRYGFEAAEMDIAPVLICRPKQ